MAKHQWKQIFGISRWQCERVGCGMWREYFRVIRERYEYRDAEGRLVANLSVRAKAPACRGEEVA